MSSPVSRTSRLAWLCLIAAGLVLTVGCPPRPIEETPTPPAPPAEERPAEKPLDKVEVPREPISEPLPREAEPTAEPLDDILRRQNETRAFLKTVYFDFDKYDLRPDAIDTLKANAAWFRSRTGFRLVIEGHCDERDTIEYNLELGSRRARAIYDYLVGLGLPADRMRTLSYGEERPVDPGHDESAWAKNRRGEFTLEK